MLDLKMMETEIKTRAVKELSLKRMVVDYYRVRYKVSYEIPVRGEFLLGWQVRFESLNEYLWSIWLLFRLEERFYTLAADSLQNINTQKSFEKELEVFSEWKNYRQLDNKADLSTGHSGRILFTAFSDLNWLSQVSKNKIKVAAQRLVDESAELAFHHFREITSKEQILASEKPNAALHNIPLIGAIGVFLCMEIVGDKRKDKLLQILESIIDALLDYSQDNDYSEGVCYDGYIFDFIIDLFPFISKPLQEKLKTNPTIKGMLVQSYALSVPGNMAHFSEIGDVEPFQLLFHQSACLRWQAIAPDKEVQFYLNQLGSKTMPSKGLYDAIRANVVCGELKPRVGVFELPATYSLRSGWSENDFAVGVSCSKSGAGHIQYDAGTVTFGTKGFWFLDDPGYQQYMNTSEREFTYSKVSHNCPLINDVPQTKKLIQFDEKKEDSQSCQAAFDLSRCYEIENLNFKRSLDLNYSGELLVRDILNQPSDLTYYWHFNREAGLFVEGGRLVVDINGTIMTVSCKQQEILGKNLLRMKGSRGQVTLQLDLKSVATVEWQFKFN